VPAKCSKAWGTLIFIIVKIGNQVVFVQVFDIHQERIISSTCVIAHERKHEKRQKGFNHLKNYIYFFNVLSTIACINLADCRAAGQCKH